MVVREIGERNMNEHNEVQRLVAESYRTRIDAEDLRKEVKALFGEVFEKERMEDSEKMIAFYQGQETAYYKVLRLIDEKEVAK